MSALTVAAVVGAVATVGSAYSQNKARKAQKKSIAAQQRQSDIANARERRNAISQGRVQRASVEAQASTSGLHGSSTSLGSIGSITSRTGENLSFLDQNQLLSEAASKANQEAADWSSRANNWDTLGKIGTAIGGRVGGPTPTPGNSGSTGN